MNMFLYISTQSCGNPKCSSGAVDTNQCKCSATYISTCPSGFTKIVNHQGLCSCEKKVRPTCPRGFTINSPCTLCSTSSNPTCPSGSTLSPSTAKCLGIKPKCPFGYINHGGCKCVKEYVRQCSSGKLSWNGCSCEGWGISKPTCGYGCQLNWSTCSCYKYGKNKTCGSKLQQINTCTCMGFIGKRSEPNLVVQLV